MLKLQYFITKYFFNSFTFEISNTVLSLVNTFCGSIVNFINILREFLHEFFVRMLVAKDKLREALSYEKFAHKMLMKLTPSWTQIRLFHVLMSKKK